MPISSVRARRQAMECLLRPLVLTRLAIPTFLLPWESHTRVLDSRICNPRLEQIRQCGAPFPSNRTVKPRTQLLSKRIYTNVTSAGLGRRRLVR